MNRGCKNFRTKVGLSKNNKKKDTPILMQTRHLTVIDSPHAKCIICARIPETSNLFAGVRAYFT